MDTQPSNLKNLRNHTHVLSSRLKSNPCCYRQVDCGETIDNATCTMVLELFFFYSPCKPWICLAILIQRNLVLPPPPPYVSPAKHRQTWMLLPASPWAGREAPKVNTNIVLNDNEQTHAYLINTCVCVWNCQKIIAHGGCCVIKNNCSGQAKNSMMTIDDRGGRLCKGWLDNVTGHQGRGRLFRFN